MSRQRCSYRTAEGPRCHPELSPCLWGSSHAQRPRPGTAAGRDGDGSPGGATGKGHPGFESDPRGRAQLRAREPQPRTGARSGTGSGRRSSTGAFPAPNAAEKLPGDAGRGSLGTPGSPAAPSPAEPAPRPLPGTLGAAPVVAVDPWGPAGARYSHEDVVDERPSPGPFQHVVQAVLEAAAAAARGPGGARGGPGARPRQQRPAAGRERRRRGGPAPGPGGPRSLGPHRRQRRPPLPARRRPGHGRPAQAASRSMVPAAEGPPSQPGAAPGATCL